MAIIVPNKDRDKTYKTFLIQRALNQLGANIKEDNWWGKETQDAYDNFVASQIPVNVVEPLWMQIARKELGVSEVVGEQDNPRILEYHKTTTLKAQDDEVAWCAAFVGWCLKEAGKKWTGSAAARSYLNYGLSVTDPRVGDIVIIKRGKEPWQGHVGFFVGFNGPYIRILGGNQSNKVSIADFNKASLLGYRRPV